MEHMHTVTAPNRQAQAKQPPGCRVEEGTDRMTVFLTGDIDHHRAAQLRVYLDQMICEKKPEIVYLNLSQIEFMDSSGLGLIMGRYSLLGRLGGRLILEKPSEVAKRMIALAAMERFIQVEV